MKKIYGFLGAAAILSMVACSKEDLGEAQLPETKGDFFMTMNITPTGNGTRAANTTQTPHQGSEVGQDYENKISDALVIFAKPASSGQEQYDVFAVLNNAPTVSNGNRIDGKTSYSATFQAERSILLNDVKNHGLQESGDSEKSVKYRMFVIANPTDAIKRAYTAAAAAYGTTPKSVQDVFTVASENDNQYWNNNNFLMTNAELSAEVKIKESDVALGTHTTPAEALSLGSVTVQRAMARFDIATGTADGTEYWKFTIENEKSPIRKLTVEMDGVTLVNMAKEAYMFKVTADNFTALGTKKLAFAAETYTMAVEDTPESGNWVFSPEQDGSYFYPMFTDLNNASASEGSIGTITGEARNLGTAFTYTSWTTIRDNENGLRDEFTPPSDITGIPTTYKFWRYCMENTNPDKAANQKNGVSTGVIFRAKFSVEPNESDSSSKFGANDNLYALGNVFFGNLQHLRDYVYMVNDEENNGHANDADVYATVSNKFKDAVAAYNSEQETDTTKFYVPEATQDEEEQEPSVTPGINILDADEDALKVLDPYLVNNDSDDTKGQGFSIYRPDEDGNYYCYYIYWNRHNNNYDNTQMGIMEFATVRNNIYKLSVSKVLRLGHPADPDDDPNTPDPDDPDEKDEFYCTIDCKILDWEVRVNGIEF